MKTFTALTLLLLVTANASGAHAADRLPEEYLGKWCAVGSATGGGSPRVWSYSRSRAECDARYKDQDMVLGPRRMDGCKAVAFVEWREDGLPVYFVTYRCKNGNKVAAKFSLDRDEKGLTAQYSQQD